MVFPSGENVGWQSQASFRPVRQTGGLEASIGTRYRLKFVIQGSRRPASRAVKTSSLPSGVKVNSPEPPNGLDGVSASMFGITSTGSPLPVTGITKRWLRRPSLQASQCRTKIRS
jgi:hypothetical protein